MDINEVRDRLTHGANCFDGAVIGSMKCDLLASDIRALLADHARLQNEKALLVEVLAEVEADAYRLIEALKDSHP